MKNEEKIDDNSNLEFLASKSNDFIEKQISSYRHKHSNAGSIITIITLFVPFFLNGLDSGNLFFKICAILPVIILLWAIVLFINILKTKSLDQGFSVNKFDELINKTYEEVLLYEIGANRSSFVDNQKILDKTNKSYFFAIKLTVFAIMFSSLLLLTNNFFKEEVEKITKVEIIKSKNMIPENDNSNGGKGNDNPSTTTGRSIPYVPPTDRTNLNDTTPSPTTKDISKGGEN
jgi:hypothetical protein